MNALLPLLTKKTKNGAARPDPDTRPRPTGVVNWRARVLLDWMKTIGWPEVQDRTVDDARNDLELLISATSIWQPAGGVRDMMIPGPVGEIPIRIYSPLTGVGPRPILVWCHGGGFVLGGLASADPRSEERRVGKECRL